MRVSMVCLTVAFTAPTARAAQQLLDGLRFIGPATRVQHGCLGCSSWTGRGLTLHHLEQWESEADMRRRIGAQEFTALLEMVEAARDPRVQFDFVAVTRGIDYVAEVRGAFGA